MIRVLGSTVPYSSPACSAAGALYRRLVGAAPALALDLAETAYVRLIIPLRRALGIASRIALRQDHFSPVVAQELGR